MLYVTRNFLVDRTAGALELMRQDGITGLARLGEAAVLFVGAARHVPQDRGGVGRAFSCRAFIPGTRTTGICSTAYAASGDAPAS